MHLYCRFFFCRETLKSCDSTELLFPSVLGRVSAHHTLTLGKRGLTIRSFKHLFDSMLRILCTLNGSNTASAETRSFAD
jgi:hypothetical protein